MLDVIRKHKRSWLVILLLGVGVLAFVMVGVGPQGGQNQGVVTIAEVNGDPITYSELETHYYRMLQTYQQLSGGRLSPADIEALNLRGQLLNEIIDQRLLLQRARELGLRVSDEELVDGIARNPAFQVAGRFDRDVYEQALLRQGLTPGEFEAQQRESLVIQKLQDLIQDSIPVTASEIEERYRWDNEEIALDFVRLKTDEFLEGIEIKDEEIKDYYDKNAALLREPLKVKTRYIEYRVDDFAADVQISEKDVQSYYDVYRDRRFRRHEAVRFSHIFIPAAPADASSEERAEPRKQMEEILKEVQGGADFGELAKQRSKGETAAQGGDMGFVGRGQLVEALDAALFALGENEVSEVIESPVGLHLLKAVEKQQDEVMALDEVREDIVKALKRERGGTRAARAAEDDREKGLDGTPLTEVVSQRNLEASVTRLFSAGETLDEIGDVEGFYRAGLSLRPGQVGPIITTADALYLLEGAERVEPAVPPVGDVREKIRETLTRRKAGEQALEKADALLAALKQSPDLRKVAADHAVTVEDTGLFPRKQAEIPEIGVLPLPLGRLTLSEREPVAKDAYVRGDSVYVMVLRKTVEADPAGLADEKEELTQRIRGEKRERVLRRLIEDLKANAAIEVHPEFI